MVFNFLFSHGYASTQLTCGWKCLHDFVGNLSTFLTVKEFGKSAKVWRRYSEKEKGARTYETWCMYVRTYVRVRSISSLQVLTAAATYC